MTSFLFTSSDKLITLIWVIHHVPLANRNTWDQISKDVLKLCILQWNKFIWNISSFDYQQYEYITTSGLILNACVYKSIIIQLKTSVIMVHCALNYGSPKNIFFRKKHYDKKKYVWCATTKTLKGLFMAYLSARNDYENCSCSKISLKTIRKPPCA